MQRCAASFVAAEYEKVPLTPQALRALHLNIPYQVRDKLLNSTTVIAKRLSAAVAI